MNLNELMSRVTGIDGVSLDRKVAPIVTVVTVDTVPSLETLRPLSTPVAHAEVGVTIDGFIDRSSPVIPARTDFPGCNRFAVHGEARSEEEREWIACAIHSSFAGFVGISLIRTSVSEDIRRAIQAGGTFQDFEMYTFRSMLGSWEEKDASKGRRAGWYVVKASPAGRYLSLVRTILSELGVKKAPLTPEEKEAARVKRLSAQIASLEKAGYKTEKVLDTD